MNRLFISILAAAALLAGCTVAEKPISQEISVQPEPPAVLEKDYINASILLQITDILNKRYVDGSKTGNDKLFEAAMQGMVSSLDPYSGYEPPKSFSQQNNRRNGELSGIGVVIAKPHRQYLHVVNVFPDSPADKAKIKPGDTIVAIDGKDLKSLNLYQCQMLLQGQNGTKVTLRVHSAGKVSAIELRRKKVIMPSIQTVMVINKNTGYVKITSFTLHSAKEFRKALVKLKTQNITGLVIDLRNNTGGHVQTTTQMLSLLLPPGKVLMTAHGRDPQKKQIIRSSKLPGAPCDTKLPVVLLVNNFTASSAEIFASALQDHKRAELVGTRTFGKGTLLHVVRLANGGALRYASGRYITPSGKFIEGKGLQPDHTVIIPLQQLHRLTLQQRRFPGVITPKIKNAVKDTQLEKALKLLEPEKKSIPDGSPKN